MRALAEHSSMTVSRVSLRLRGSFSLSMIDFGKIGFLSSELKAADKHISTQIRAWNQKWEAKSIQHGGSKASSGGSFGF